MNLLSFDEGEEGERHPCQSGISPKGCYVFMATSGRHREKDRAGRIFAPAAERASSPSTLKAGNRLVGVGLTGGKSDILLFSDTGKVVRFPEGDVRAMGRAARGVRGIVLRPKQSVIALIIAASDQAAEATVLTATRNGYGKRTPLTEYTKHRRGGQGMISIPVSARNGVVVGACIVAPEDQAMLITSGGTLIRTREGNFRCRGATPKGVHLIGLGDGEHLAGLERIAEADEA